MTILSMAGGLVAVAHAGRTGAATAPPATAPLSPTQVTASQTGVAPDLTVSWTPATTGPAATGAIVQLFASAQSSFAQPQYVSGVSCEDGCTSANFRELLFGETYEVAVYPTDASSAGAAVASNHVTLATTCPVGACLTVNATSTLGPANHAASGILNSVFPTGNDQPDLTSLATTMYRSAPGYTATGALTWASWNTALAAGAQTTLILSDLWETANAGDPSTPTPWSNWTAYSSWVTATVKAVLASGEAVNYWEPYNEPGGTGYYSSANQATVTVPLLLQQFLVAYRAIKAADPAARIIGPSLQHWSDWPGQYPAPDLDMVTFLNFAVSNDLQLAAISWHEIQDNYGPTQTSNTLLPAILEDHVAQARKLLAARPSLGNPMIFIDEYGMPEVQLIPGWDVAYLAALTNAGVSSATRSCWSGTCGTPSLDGLLSSDSLSPWNTYWDRMVYASLHGSMVPTTSTSDTVALLASYSPSPATVTGLIGRGVGCTQDPWCAATWPAATLAAPTAVNVTVTVPWTSGRAELSLSDVPGRTIGPTAAPTPVTSSVNVDPAGPGRGTVTFSIPSFADGDAYGFSLTHA